MMGAEAKCTLTFGRQKADGKALLETDALVFRGGDLRLSIPYKRMSYVEAREGVLRVTSPDGTASFAIGDRAAKWADTIRHPPSLADKLGVKSGQCVLFLGVTNAELRHDLEQRGATVSTRAGSGLDAIVYAAENRDALEQLGPLTAHLKPDGALWVIRPKGHPDVSESDVRRAGKAAGLVDVKVVRFSDTHTAEKFVIPLGRR